MAYMDRAETSVWETPRALFDELNAEYHFTLDPCATPENAKCENYFTEQDDGLSKNWGGQSVFCNPPYGLELRKWVKKAWEEAQKPGTTVVLLIPARTDTGWFHDYCLRGKVRFLRGRLKFGGAKNNAPFPSMVVTFDGT